MTASMVRAEFCRTVHLARSYWLEYLADILVYSLGFLLLITVFRAASENYGPEGYLITLIGYTIWKICASMLVDIVRIVTEEAHTGTLEQLFLSVESPQKVFMVRSLGILVNRGVRGILMAGLLAVFLGIVRPVSSLMVIIFCLTMAGACGSGFALAGLALVYKQVGGSAQLLWQMLVFFTGALAPIRHPVLEGLAKLLPLTWGITSLRSLLIDKVSVAELWHGGLLTGLFVSNVFYISIGVILFTWGQRRARELGVLGHY